MVQTFKNDAGIRIKLGNLHIRTPKGVNVSVSSNIGLVTRALHRLESDTQSDSATQPVVQVLVGDCNLTREQGEEATQPIQPENQTWRTVWQVHATTAERSGD